MLCSYCQVARLLLSAGQSLANLVRGGLVTSTRHQGRRCSDLLLLELDRHCASGVGVIEVEGRVWSRRRVNTITPGQYRE